MKRCPYCQAEVADDAVRCDACGRGRASSRIAEKPAADRALPTTAATEQATPSPVVGTTAGVRAMPYGRRPTKTLGALTREQARKLSAGEIVELGAGVLADDARKVIETRRVTVLRFGRPIIESGEYLQAASEAVPSGDQLVQCPACSEQIIASARKCKHCGEWIVPPSDVSQGTSTLRKVGVAVGVVGALILLSALAMDTSVATPSGTRVHNIGLLRQQQNFMMLGGLAVIGGIVMFVAGRRR